MKYMRTMVSEDGETHMETVEVDFSPADFVPGQPSLDLSAPIDAKSAVFVQMPAGWPAGWHPSPHRQFVIGLTGEIEIQTSDGNVCCIGAGDIILLEDTSGKGHHTRAVGDTDFSALLVALS